MTPFLSKLVAKKQFFRGLTNFFHNYWIVTQLLILIKSPNIFDWKSAKQGK